MTGYHPASAGARVEGSPGRPPVSRPGARQQGHHLEIPEGEGDGEGVLDCSASCRQTLHYCHVSLYYSVKLAVWLYYDEDTMVTFYDVLLACVSLRNRGLDSFGSLCGMKVFEPWWTG